MAERPKPKAGVSENEAQKRVDSGEVPPPRSTKSYVTNPSRPKGKASQPKKDEP